MKNRYFIISISFLLVLFFSNCNNSNLKNKSDSNLLSDSLSENSKTLNNTIFPITFIKTKDFDSSCYLCKEARLYVSPNKDKYDIACFVTPNYTIMKRDIKSLEENCYYIFKTKQKNDSILLLSEKDTLFTIKEDEYNFIEGIYDKYLFIDFGTTAQNRSFQVYNLETHRKIVDEKYFDGNIEFNGNNLFFYVSTKIKRDSICPKPQEWEKDGNPAIVVEKIKINIENLRRESTKQYECRMEE